MIEKLVFLSIAPQTPNQTQKIQVDVHNWWTDDSTVLKGDFQETRRSVADFLLAVHASKRLPSELTQRALTTVLSLFRPESFVASSVSNSSCRNKRKSHEFTNTDLDWCLDYWCPAAVVASDKIKTKIMTVRDLSDIPVIALLLGALGQIDEAASVSQHASYRLQMMIQIGSDKRYGSESVPGGKERRTNTHCLRRRLHRLHRRYAYYNNDVAICAVQRHNVHALVGKGANMHVDVHVNTSTQERALELQREISQQRLKRKLLERQTRKLELGM